MVKKRKVSISARNKLIGLPSGVLLQIFCSLAPLDLLHVARTSKDLRNVLMSRLSRFVWESALANVVGLPPCPPDLTEPQYADLTFDPHCDLCLLPCVTDVYWLCRLRCCMDCLTKNFRSYVVSGFDSEPYPYECYVPYITTVRGRLFRPSDIEEFNSKRLSPWQDPDAQTRFLEEKKANITMRIKHTDEYKRWQDSLTQSYSVAVVDARNKRKKSIIEKLEDLGWADEIASMDEVTKQIFTNLPEVNRQRDLSDRIWKKIKDDIIAFLQTVRTKRNASKSTAQLSERVALIGNLRDTFISTRCVDEPQPCLADFCYMEDIQSSLVMPPGTEFTEQSMNELSQLFPELAESWRQRTSNKLVQMMPSIDNVSSPDSLDRLELATTFFTCTRKCRDPIGYPRVLVHRCATHLQEDVAELNDTNTDFYQNLVTTLNQQPWNFQEDRIAFNDRASAAAYVIVQAAGLDPDSTTSQTMNDLDFWLVCSLCTTPEGQLVMSWDAAVAHSINIHEGTMEVTDWSILNSAFPITSADILDMVSFFTLDYCCYRCRLHLSFEAIPTHMRDKHRLAYDDFHGPYDDCYRHLDASPPKPIRIQVPNVL